MATEVKAFKCDWCHRCFTRRNNAETHEVACKNNPERRQCITCVHGIVDELAFEKFTTNTAPYCDVHNEPVYKKPYFIECDSSGGFDTGEGFWDEKPMPGTCFYYEYKGKPGWTKKQRVPTEEERRTYL